MTSTSPAPSDPARTMNDKEAKNGRYDSLNHNQLVRLLEKRDRERKLGLVWERDELEADQALESEFVAVAPVTELNEGSAPWRNFIIEGDNYDALRWLRMTWAGRIKCIYVDPPYNTGNRDWVYNDHYFSADERYRHSTWLEFLYRRFALARDLLTDDGVVLVSINDENRAKLELLLDDVLPGMRIGSLVWRTRSGGNEGREAFLSDNHEHILVYGNKGFRFGGTEKSLSIYSNLDNDPRGDWTSGDLTINVSYTDRRAGKGYYPVYDPETDIYYPCNPDAVWRYASRTLSGSNARIKTKFMEDWISLKQINFPKEQRVVCYVNRYELDEAIAAGDVPSSGRSPLIRNGLPDLDFWIGKKIGFGTPRFKRFLRDLKTTTQPLSSWITPQSEKSSVLKSDNAIVSGTNDEGAKSIKDVFGEKVFNYAKPPSLIRGLISQATSPGDVVLDFFAGSATAAHAVMALNADDSGDRRFIMVSSTEATVDDKEKNICRQVTAERIRRLNASEDPEYAPLSAEFAYLRCRKLRFEDLDYDDGLTPTETWAALEALHQLPLTPFAPAPWVSHETDNLALVYVDRFADNLIPWLKARAAVRKPTFVYSWAPGQVRDRLDGTEVELRGVYDTLVSRFRQ